MSSTTETISADRLTREHLDREVAEIRAIYELLFPVENLTFLFRQGREPTWGQPVVTEGAPTLNSAQVDADYLGLIRRPGASPAAPHVTVSVTIPRAPLPSEIQLSEAPWVPIRPLKPLHRLWPLGYEQVRYLAEMARKRRGTRRHSRKALPFGDGATAFFPRPAEEPPEKPPAILIGMHWLEVGGAEKLGFDCIRWALEAGLRVFVVAGVASIQRLADRLPDHPDLRFIRLDRYLPPHLWPRYVEALARSQNIRLIHIHHCRQLYDALPHLRATLPWIQVIDSTHIVEYADGGYPRSSGVWTNFIDLHHVISGELVDYYRDTFHVVGKVVLGRMLERHAVPGALPAPNFKAGQKTLHVSFIGRLYYQKRPVVVVEALRGLAAWARANGVAFSATMVGEGPFLGEVRRLLQKYALTEAVEMVAANADVPALLARSDVLLLPSNNEGLALVCYEAIEQGCMPISTDVGSQDEIVPPDLLVPLAPRAAVQRIVAAVDDMWRGQDVIDRQRDQMQRLWERIAADPTAKEVLMPLYRAHAKDRPE
ncbi:MAG: glycosyltransferase [Paracoccus sp. (in: a-proteobacteria)]|uniref:glycosyltransferase n=1 Tax=Paracoccus sp. TaxID=267 RepID=UPI0039E2C900